MSSVEIVQPASNENSKIVDETNWCEWIPLEANEEAWNKYLKKLGVEGVRCEEIWSFDDHIPFIQRPHFALVLCYSNFGKVKQGMDQNYNKSNKSIPDNVFFAQQKIKNACGTFALIHSIAHNRAHINIGKGIFGKWFEIAEKHKVEDRSDILANDKDFTQAHKECANEGTTVITGADKCPDCHYICYVNVNDCLYEFDSRMKFPRDCGPTSANTLLSDAALECQKLIISVENLSFSALALVTDENPN